MDAADPITPLPPTAFEGDAELQRRIARSRQILAGIEAKIERLQHAKIERQRALASLNAATFRGLDRESTS
jgi:hypothetical protein